MKNKKLSAFITILTLTAAVAFVSCPNPLLKDLKDTDSGNPSAAGKGTSSLSVSVHDGSSLAGARTIQPVSVLVTSLTYDLSMTYLADSSVVTLTGKAYNEIAVSDLSVGSWELTITAKDVNGFVVFLKTQLVEIASGANTLAISLDPLQTAGGKGSLSYSINLPTGSAYNARAFLGTDFGSLCMLPNKIYDPADMPNAGVTDNCSDTGAPSIAFNLTNIASGTWFLCVEIRSGSLYDAAVKPTRLIEVVRIYDNRVSEAPALTLEASAIGMAPAAPSGLALSASGSTVSLSWTDNSNTEDKFIVYRDSVYLGEVPAGLTSGTFADPGAGSDGMTLVHSYEVAAANDFGESARSSKSWMGTGKVDIDFNITNPSVQTITFSEGTSVSVQQGLSLDIATTTNTTLAASGTNWNWYVDNVAAGTTSSLSWDTSSLPLGQHIVSVSVMYGGVRYSGHLLVTIASQTAAMTHPVVYNANGAAGGTTPASFACGENESYTVAANTGGLVRMDYLFAGWSLNPDGSGTVYLENSAQTMGTAAVTYYARWVRPLVARWEFNRQFSDTTFTELINGITSVAVGVPTTPTDSGYDSASALVLNGSSALTVGANPYSESLAPWTIAAWIRVTPTAETQVLFSGSSANSIGFRNTGFFAAVDALNSNFATPVPTEWTHVAFVNDGTCVRLYVNGVEDANTVGIPQMKLPLSAIGMYSSASFLNGSIDSLRVYQSALTQTDVTSLYESYRKKITLSSETLLYSPHGSISGAQDGEYLAHGTAVSLTAVPTPADGTWVFQKWVIDGVDSGDVNPIPVTMDKVHKVHAVFASTVPRGSFQYHLIAGTGTMPAAEIEIPLVSTRTVQLFAPADCYTKDGNTVRAYPCWNTDSSGSGGSNYWPGDTITINNDVNLYVNWNGAGFDDALDWSVTPGDYAGAALIPFNTNKVGYCQWYTVDNIVSPTTMTAQDTDMFRLFATASGTMVVSFDASVDEGGSYFTAYLYDSTGTMLTSTGWNNGHTPSNSVAVTAGSTYFVKVVHQNQGLPLMWASSRVGRYVVRVDSVGN